MIHINGNTHTATHGGRCLTGGLDERSLDRSEITLATNEGA